VPAAALFGSLGVSLLLSLVIGYGGALVGALAPRFAGSLLVFAAISALVFVGASRWLAASFARDGRAFVLELSRPPLRLALASVGLGLALHGPADFLDALGHRYFPLPAEALAERIARLLPPSLGERALLFVCVAGLVPLSEELFFRGALFGAVSKLASTSTALLASALGFTISHAEPRSFAAIGAIAIVLGVVRALSGSLSACILIHATFNATTLLVLFARPPALEPAEPSLPLFAVGTLLSAALLIAGLKRAPDAKASVT
jgi:membrane protease YdiL (CAAX protease family)